MIPGGAVYEATVRVANLILGAGPAKIRALGGEARIVRRAVYETLVSTPEDRRQAVARQLRAFPAGEIFDHALALNFQIVLACACGLDAAPSF